jgi:hypothetical protein
MQCTALKRVFFCTQNRARGGTATAAAACEGAGGGRAGRDAGLDQGAIRPRPERKSRQTGELCALFTEMPRRNFAGSLCRNAFCRLCLSRLANIGNKMGSST